MKKLRSLIKACMSSDMKIFKIKTKGNSRNKMTLPLILTFCFMFTIWSNANILFEKMAPMHLTTMALSIIVFLISLMTIIEGIYKSGSLLYNCKDDQLLLSLPIKRTTVLFIRIFKFYVFEVIFNALFFIPFILAYLRWAPSLDWTFFLISTVMFFMLPIIPIIISCILGALISSISSHFKHKNIATIITSFAFLLIIFYVSFNSDSIFEYLIKHATDFNDLITKIYYPAGIYGKLVDHFNYLDLFIFILVNISLFAIGIYILSIFYFKLNSRIKKVATNKKVSTDKLNYNKKSITRTLIKKELDTFFKIPVFIINAGFGLLLFIIAIIVILAKFDLIVTALTDPNTINLSKNLIMDNLSLLIFTLISATAYMTSITNSVISLEGRSINILKSLPLKTKTILMSKVYSSLVLTTPVLVIGSIILFIRFKISLIECLLLLLLSVLIPLVSHFIGILVNLKYPKLDAENSTEVVKQSTSSFLSVMIGMILFIVTVIIVPKIAGIINATLFLLIATIIYIIINTILYSILVTKGVKEFNQLSI